MDVLPAYFADNFSDCKHFSGTLGFHFVQLRFRVPAYRTYTLGR